MKPGSKAGVAREGENAVGADDFEGWDKFGEFCLAKKGLGEKVPTQKPFPDRPINIIAINDVFTITNDIIIIIIVIIIIIITITISFIIVIIFVINMISAGFFCGWDLN